MEGPDVAQAEHVRRQGSDELSDARAPRRSGLVGVQLAHEQVARPALGVQLFSQRAGERGIGGWGERGRTWGAGGPLGAEEGGIVGLVPRRPPVEFVVEPNSESQVIGDCLNACNGFYGNHAAGEDFAVSLSDQRTVESREWSTQLERIGKRRDTARWARACQRQLDPPFVQLRGRRFRGVGHLVIRRDERAVNVRYHERDGAGI